MTKRAIDLLQEHGAAEIAHPGGTLLAHLKRVASRLESWGARADLQVAGLCHACYGTDGFDTGLLGLDQRADLAAVIGADAESLVYCYASCDRQASYATLPSDEPSFRDRFTGEALRPPLALRRDFAELTAANELDLVHHSPEIRDRWGPGLRTLFTRWRPLLSEAAWQDCEALLPDA